MTEIIDGTPQPVNVGDHYVKATWFETVGSGTTSGTITKPAGGGSDVAFVMDEWGSDTDALVSTMANGKPTFESPVTAGGSVITTTFDTAGEFAFSGTPSPAGNHAVVFVYKCYLKNFNVNESLFESEPLDVITPGDVDDTPVDGATTSPISSNWAYDHNVKDATALVQGHATAAQITKLDGIEAGSTKYPDTGEQAFLDADHTKLDGVEAGADVTDAVNVGSSIHGVTNKATPVDADKVPLIDTEAANVLKTSTWANIKAFLKTYFDTLYGSLGASHARSHALDGTSDHSIGSLTNTYLVKSDGTKLAPATNTDTQVAAAVTASHAAVTVSAPIDLSGQAISLKNNAVTPATVTTIDTDGTLAGNSDTVIPVQKAVKTYADTKTTLTAVKADADIASAISLKHTAGTDTALGTVGTKDPPIDADKALYRDSTASDALVTSTWTQVKAFLKTYFDTLYNLYVHPNHSGDVTSVADGATAIANKAVTLTKMDDMATARLLGRNTAGAGAPEVISDIPTAITIGGKYVYRADGTDVPLADGGTGQSTAQAAIDALTQVSAATNEHVFTKDTATGNAIFKVATGGGVDFATAAVLGTL